MAMTLVGSFGGISAKLNSADSSYSKTGHFSFWQMHKGGKHARVYWRQQFVFHQRLEKFVGAFGAEQAKLIDMRTETGHFVRTQWSRSAGFIDPCSAQKRLQSDKYRSIFGEKIWHCQPVTDGCAELNVL